MNEQPFLQMSLNEYRDFLDRLDEKDKKLGTNYDNEIFPHLSDGEKAVYLDYCIKRTFNKYLPNLTKAGFSIGYPSVGRHLVNIIHKPVNFTHGSIKVADIGNDYSLVRAKGMYINDTIYSRDFRFEKRQVLDYRTLENFLWDFIESLIDYNPQNEKSPSL